MELWRKIQLINELLGPLQGGDGRNQLISRVLSGLEESYAQSTGEIEMPRCLFLMEI